MSERRRPGWLHPAVVSTALVAVAAGYAQFSVTTVLGDVARAFGEVTDGGDITAQVGLSTTTLGVGLAVIRLAGGGALVTAAAADRFGRRRLLVWLSIGGLALTVALSLSPGFWVFVALAALARPMLSGANTVVGVIAAEETRTADRAWALAAVQAAYAVGSGAVAVLRGVVEGLSFRMVFAAAAVPLLALPFVLRRVRETSLFRQSAAARGAAARTRLGAVDRAHWGTLAVVAGVTAAVGLVSGPAFTYLFVYGENVLGASPAAMAALVLAAGPIGLVGLLTGRWAADHVGRRISAAVGVVGVTVTAWVAYQGSFVALAVGYLASIAASGGLGPALSALVAEVFPTEERATAGGWAAGAGVLGSVAGLALFGALSEVLGGFDGAATTLFLPLAPLALLLRLVPETRGVELDEPDQSGADVQA